MPAPPIVGINDIVRVTYWQRLYGQRIYTVFNMRCVTAPAAGTTYVQAMDNLAIRLSDTAKFPLSGWTPLVSHDLIFDEVRVQRVYPTRDIYLNQAIATIGGDATSANASNVAASIEKRTLHPGRKGIGRIQMAGIPSDKYGNGTLQPTYLNALQTVWQNLPNLVSITADSSVWAYCLFSGAPVDSLNDVFTIQAKDTVRTMHRRTVRVGE